MNKRYIGVGIVVLVVAFVGLLALMQKRSADSSKVRVVTSFYPLYFFAAQIGGDKASVVNLTPAGSEPHDYEPTAKDMTTIVHSQLLVLNGAGLEPWRERVVQNLSSKTIVVVAGEKLATLEGDVHEHEEHHHEHAEDENHTEEVYDPHVWLSPSLAAQMVDSIARGYIAADPVNEVYYMQNAETLKAKLVTLDVAYQHLAACPIKSFVTSHAAFGYLAQAYGLNQVSIAGISPEEEPSAQELAAVAEFAKANNVRYIFFESLVSPKLAQTLAAEVGAQTLVLNPIEGLTREELLVGKDYITEMYANLKNLEIALQCNRA